MAGSKNKFVERFEKIENNSNRYIISNSFFVCKLKLHNFKKIRKLFTLPYATELQRALVSSTVSFCETTNHVIFSYVQGSEVSFLFKEIAEKNQSIWFEGEVQKINSFVSSKFTLLFNKKIQEIKQNQSFQDCFFTCKTFSLPEHEVKNYFVLQQRNCIHDSIHFWHDYYLPNDTKKHCHEKETTSLSVVPSWKEDCKSLHFKYGTVVMKFKIEKEIENLPEGAFSFYTKHNLIPKEQVERNIWTPCPLNQRFEDSKTILEEIL